MSHIPDKLWILLLRLLYKSIFKLYMVGQGIKEMLKIVHWEEKVFACLSMLTILADVQHTS